MIITSCDSEERIHLFSTSNLAHIPLTVTNVWEGADEVFLSCLLTGWVSLRCVLPVFCFVPSLYPERKPIPVSKVMGGVDHSAPLFSTAIGYHEACINLKPDTTFSPAFTPGQPLKR